MGNVDNVGGDDNDKECRCQYNQIGNKEMRIEEEERSQVKDINYIHLIRCGV